LNCKTPFILFFTDTEILQSNSFHWPNVDSAIGFTSITFSQYFAFNGITIDDVNPLTNFLSIKKQKKEDAFVNCKKYWIYLDDNTKRYNDFHYNIIDRGKTILTESKLFEKEKINEKVYLFTRNDSCKSTKRDFDIAEQISKDYPFAIEYFPTEMPENKDNIMLQVLKKYIPYDINGGWIPFDMKERKDMYSKAFEELAKYMKKNIQ
jgi:hypothetical protein